MATEEPIPADADLLGLLAQELRDEETVVSDHIADLAPESSDALGRFVAAGPRCSADPTGYALVAELIREGYLLHYGESRILADADPDLALLAGDYLYAKGLERLSAIGDQTAVSELSDLISLSAQLHAEARDSEVGDLWLATAIAVGLGANAEHQRGKAALRAGPTSEPLTDNLRDIAHDAGLGERLANAAEAVGFSPSDRG